MAAQSTAHTYTSVIVERAAKPPATMFPIVQRLGSAKESRLGLNFRILCAKWPSSTSSASSRPKPKNNLPISQQALAKIALKESITAQPSETIWKIQLGLRECLRPLFSQGRSRPGRFLHLHPELRRLDYSSLEQGWSSRAFSLRVATVAYLHGPESTRRSYS